MVCLPTTQSKKISVGKNGKLATYHIEHKFVEKYLKTKGINSQKSCIFAEKLQDRQIQSYDVQ